MPKVIPTISEVSKKWSTVTPGRKSYYISGVQKVTDWAGPTAEAEGNYETGVTEAIADKRFGKGVVKTGTAGWKEPTIRKGGRNWGPGVRDGGPKYEKNFAPFMTEIRARKADEPPKFPKGSPENLARVEHYAMALRRKKLELLGAS